MFQYWVAKLIADKLGWPLRVCIHDGLYIDTSLYPNMQLPILEGPICDHHAWNYSHTENAHTIDIDTIIRDHSENKQPIILDKYLENASLVKSNASYVRELFRRSPELPMQDRIAIHIRLGDVAHKSLQDDESFIDFAKQVAAKYPTKDILIVSEEPYHVYTHIMCNALRNEGYNARIKCVNNSVQSDFDDITCSKVVVALNSTFSWWACFLNPYNPDVYIALSTAQPCGENDPKYRNYHLFYNDPIAEWNYWNLQKREVYNTKNLIQERARDECKNFISKQNIDKLDDSFLIVDICDRKVSVVRIGKFHDRSSGVLQYLKNVAQTCPLPINGRFAIGLYDSYNQDASLTGVLVFSRQKDNRGQILIPDFYAINNYYGHTQIVDKLAFEQKEDTALFIGCTTGDSDPLRNDRLKLCEWARGTPSVRAYISNIVQIEESAVANAYPMYQQLLHHNMTIEEQCTCKYLINVDGNTCAWDRLPWIMASNSICLKKISNNMNWYYPFLEEYKHYIPFDDFNTILDVINNKTIDYNKYLTASHEFVSTFMSPSAHAMYTGFVLHELSKVDCLV